MYSTLTQDILERNPIVAFDDNTSHVTLFFENLEDVGKIEIEANGRIALDELRISLNCGHGYRFFTPC